MNKLNSGRWALGLMSLTIWGISGCKKLPDFGALSTNFVVVTKYDNNAEFSTYKTFAIRDTIQVITENPKDSIWFDQDAQSIIQEVVKNMQDAGYTRVPVGSSITDLGIQLVGLRNTTIYSVPPGYWWGYPGWYPPCYWGYCGGWGYWYSWGYTYSVSTGSLIIEMVDLKNAGHLEKLNIVWNASGSGQVGTSTSFVVSQCLRTVDQAFLQSPYLKTH